jgi:tRNA nucleotidyltransferase/poly(A) polymerase
MRNICDFYKFVLFSFFNTTLSKKKMKHLIIKSKYTSKILYIMCELQILECAFSDHHGKDEEDKEEDHYKEVSLSPYANYDRLSPTSSSVKSSNSAAFEV